MRTTVNLDMEDASHPSHPESGPVGSGVSTERACAWLASLRRELASEQDHLIELVHQDTAKPPFETLMSDVVPLLSSCAWHEKNAGRLLRARRAPGTPWWMRHQSHKILRAPLGHIGIIATWNYPLLLVGVQMIQALVAGNRISVKPSERSPRSQGALLDVFERSWEGFGLPAGAITRWPATREGGGAMLASGGLDHVVFTGSTEVGRQIAAWGAESLTPTTLELSGRDSAIVLEDADPVLAARTIWHALTFNAGQTCMAPRRVLVARAVYAEFVRALGLVAAGTSTRTLVDEAAAQLCDDLVRDAVRAGGRSLTGTLQARRGRDVVPTVVIDCPRGAALVEGAQFGPVLGVLPFDGEADLLAVHRSCTQHLSCSVFSKKRARAERLAPLLGTGVVTHNDSLIPSAHPGTSVAGRGESGWGASQGEEGLLGMTRAVHVSHTGAARTPLEPDPRVGWRTMSRFVRRFYGGRAANASGSDRAPEAAAGGS